MEHFQLHYKIRILYYQYNFNIRTKTQQHQPCGAILERNHETFTTPSTSSTLPEQSSSLTVRSVNCPLLWNQANVQWVAQATDHKEGTS